MSQLQSLIILQASPDAPDYKGRHYALIRDRIGTSFTRASFTRAQALGNVRLQREPWHSRAGKSLEIANTEAWSAQNDVDRVLDSLQDIRTFATPLLKSALKEKYRLDIDVANTYLRLYLPKGTPWYVIDTSSGVTTRTVSLLDAAIHNFARAETFEPESDFITRPDQRGHFDIVPIRRTMGIGQFQALCRELDIGARYKRHLESVLLATDPVASTVLQLKVTASQKAALKAAVHLALAKKDIGDNAASVVSGLIYGQRGLTLDGKVMQGFDLAMMDTTLTGIVVFAPVEQQRRGTDKVIVYVPHDPEHPLKEYPSITGFMQELTRQLRDNKTLPSNGLTYQQFFSQFIDQQQRGHFFAGLGQRLSIVKWHEKQPLDPRPTWRETPVKKPHLQFSVAPITRPLWEHLYQQTLNKILNDGREIAVSTADTDSKARWAWWDNFKKIVSDIFNVALMVVAPFVPGLGELMLAYTAYQLTNDIIEGVVDLAEGLWVEAAEHVISVVTDVIQLAGFAAGGAIVNEFRLKLSPFIEGTQPVQLANGETRLWNPDLTPYAQKNLALAEYSTPDELGLHRHGDNDILPLDERLYAVEKDPVTGVHQVLHPDRPDAYAPKLAHNGRGAWVHEGEHPRTWDGVTLMKRLGHSTDGLSPEQLENILLISGVDEGALRRMYVENTAPPLLLDDSLKHFRTFDDAPAPASPDPNAHQLQRHYPTLSADIAEALVAGATKDEFEVLSEKRIPQNLRGQARECAFEIRTARAFEGFYRANRLSVDTERLALNTLRLNTDTFGDLRIDVRDGVDGELRCSVGPEEASIVRHLLRDKWGRYEVRDADNYPINGAADLYESILRALPKQQSQELGYQPGQGAWFKDWLIAKTAPPAERRTVLLEPAIRPVAEPQLMLLLRGPVLSTKRLTLEERVTDLYPTMRTRDVDAFVRSLNALPEPSKVMESLEDELTLLRNTVQWWLEQKLPTLPDDPVIYRGTPKHIADRLLECFERRSYVFDESSSLEGGYTLNLSSQFQHHDLERWWKQLPDLKKYFDQVTTLSLDNTHFSAGPEGLLKDFRHVRHLSARRCELQRLPEGVGQMHLLETLRLTDNHLELTPEAVEQLRNLTRMETLRLDNNPLGRSPNVERMPHLTILNLSHTGIDHWPPGLFSKRRPRGFFLDLQDNPITSVPKVIPGSDSAMVIARARISAPGMPQTAQFEIGEYRQSVGLPRRTVYVPAAEHARRKWPVSNDSDLWGSAPGLGTYRAEAWSRLITEPNADGFFSVIDKLTESSDYRVGGEWRRQLSIRVWNMIDAIDLDTSLREELFTMATAPTTCADAGAQLFNNMGVKVLASRAYSYSTYRAPLEKALVTLAKGAARLERVDDIARADIMARSGTPDEVEVYLAYETALADRLQLPWQSESMLYRPVAGVSDNAIDQAFDTVLTMEEGDGLVNAMLEQPFWVKYLLETWPTEFQANKQRYERLSNALESLRETQTEWAKAKALNEPRQYRLEERMRVLTQQLSIPEHQVFTGHAMTEQTYEALYHDLGYQRQEWARAKTREALERTTP
ncbi:NEL-type E3 ubiquitin ligase domain-containing protein [Pseudomonas sp. dw_612]|uniref:NEL-type E3 ubiquitin ligase domain-containing protein n=1 Tax=Pseudomonas sp. dw_612 TaxID=2720080 RepID=UPI001BD492AF|nr:NEL-type E3 ubiquitin ligase domain-containing protein [Pseudomonas sp. dw_612]